MDDFFRSIGEAIKKRANSAFLGTYALFWATFHWQGIYTTLFTDQDKIYEKFTLLKNEYAAQYFFGYKGWDDWAFYLSFFIPLLLTYAFIWLAPRYVLLPAFIKEREYKVNKQRVIFDNEMVMENYKTRLADRSKETIQAQEQLVRKEKDLERLDPTIAWSKEYEKLLESGLANSLKEIAESIYKHGGRVERYVEHNSWRGIDLNKDTIAIAHTNGLIEINDDRISLTDKGKYFLRQSYQSRF